MRPERARARVSSEVTVEYETRGDPTDPPVLLIAGLGAQMISWRDGFCTGLADGGRYVIRFDNRDSGASTSFDGSPLDLGAVIAAVTAGDFGAARGMVPYLLRDLAADTVGLLDELDVPAAHLVGSSMGGMIGQLVAIHHPERTLTLTSMMSSTGEPEFGQSTPAASAALAGPVPADRAGYVSAMVARARVWGSRRYFDADEEAAYAGASFDRGHSPTAVPRQLAALLANGSNAPGLRSLDVPTLVVHGTDDTLITPSGGERTAALVPGARLLLVPDMGHDRPPPLWPLLWDALVGHTAVRR